MTIRITGDGPKITATGSGSTVLVEISTGQHDPGSFSGVHNDLAGRSTAGAHVGTAVSIDPTGFAGNLDGTITNAQLLAAAVDDLTTGGGGGGLTTEQVQDLVAAMAVAGTNITLTYDDTAGTLTIDANSGADLSDSTPQALGTAAAGTGTAAARDDHVHAMPTAADVGADADGAAQAVADTLGTAATLDVGTTAGTVAAGDDSRLSDARTPVSHNHAASEVTSGTLDIARIPTGTTSTTVPLGNDSRFTDSRTPTAHNHAASEITSGTIDQARLGTGSAGAGAKFLADDQTYKTVSSGIADPGGSNDDFLQRKAGAWAYRTPAQVKTDLGVSSPATTILPVAVGDYILLPRGLGSAYAAWSPSSSAANSNDRVTYCPFFVDRGITIDELALHVVVANAGASAVLRLGIHADNAGRPGTVVADGGTASINSTGVKSLALSPAVALTRGWYWSAMVAQNLDTAGTNPTFSGLQNTMAQAGAAAVQASNNPYAYLIATGVSGALANNPTVSMSYTAQPTTFNVYAKVSALA